MGTCTIVMTAISVIEKEVIPGLGTSSAGRGLDR